MDIISKVVAFDSETMSDIKKNFRFLYQENYYSLQRVSNATGIPLGTILNFAAPNQCGISGEDRKVISC